MKGCTLQIPIQMKASLISQSGKPRMTQGDGLPSKLAPRTICRVSSRRLLLESMGFSAAVIYVRPVLTAPLPEMKEPEIIRSLKLRSGVKIQDVVEGEGAEAHEGDLVEFNYVCRRSNGYFVHSTVDQFSGESRPVVLPLDEKQIIQGLKEVLIGMKVGGKRRALIPPTVGYVSETLQPIPDEESKNKMVDNLPSMEKIRQLVLYHESNFYVIANQCMPSKMDGLNRRSLVLAGAFCLMRTSHWYLRFSS